MIYGPDGVAAQVLMAGSEKVRPRVFVVQRLFLITGVIDSGGLAISLIDADCHIASSSQFLSI